MEWLLIAYAAVACIWWGFFIHVDQGLDDGIRSPVTNMVMAAIWPVTVLLLVGHLLAWRLRP